MQTDWFTHVKLSVILITIKEQLKLGILSVKKQEKDSLHLTFTDKYYWIEFIEDNAILKYAYEVAYTQIEDYEKAFNRLPEILSQMEPLVYVWKDHYIGYTTNPAIDDFFYKNALWDALQAAEWYAFPKDCKFGGIPFEKYVHTVLMLIAINIKHLQFAYLLLDKNSHLKIHNLLSIYKVESEIIDLISDINDISVTEAKTIYNTLVLNFENLSVHSMERSAAPSFIKLSDHQILRSLCGCLDRPFEFMLDELRQQYPKEWDINTNLREQEFRNELYSFFEPTRFYRINRSVEIKENGKIITDIDACIADKVSVILH